MTVRKTAKALGVHKDTAFRWRHRFLEAMSQMNLTDLSGIVEADETFFKESSKGRKKDMLRPAKHRGEPAAQRGLSREQIPVLVARDCSTGKTLTKALPSRTAKDIGKALVPALAMDVVLCSDNASAYRTLAKAMDIELRCVPANPKKKRKGEVYHIQNFNAYDSRLKGWMFRFRGVATKNLPNWAGTAFWTFLLHGSFWRPPWTDTRPDAFGAYSLLELDSYTSPLGSPMKSRQKLPLGNGMRRLAITSSYFSESTRSFTLAKMVPIPNMGKGTKDYFNGKCY